jgi:lipoate-protein ligase A
MTWRVIPFRYYEPIEKICFNEVSLTLVQKTKQPLFFISGWSEDCINLGAGQNYEKILNLKQIKKNNLRVVRRQGGGGATYLSREGEISWAMVYEDKEFNPSNLESIYEKNLQFLIHLLNNLGIKAKYKSINDVVTNKGKISGSTLKHENGFTYFGGTLIYKIDKHKVEQYLRPELDNYKKSLPEKEKKLSSIQDFTNHSFEELIQIIQEDFLKEKDFELLDWTEEEIQNMKQLVSIYSSESWIKHGKKIS